MNMSLRRKLLIISCVYSYLSAFYFMFIKELLVLLDFQSGRRDVEKGFTRVVLVAVAQRQQMNPNFPDPPSTRNRYLQRVLQLAANRHTGREPGDVNRGQDNGREIIEQWTKFVRLGGNLPGDLPWARKKALDGEEVFIKFKQQLHSFCEQIAKIRGSNRRLPTQLEDEQSLFLLRHLSYTIAQPIERRTSGSRRGDNVHAKVWWRQARNQQS